MQIKGAIFDMDGTLVDSLGTWDIMWQRVGEAYMGISDFKPAEEVDKKVRTMIYRDAMAYFMEYYSISGDLEEFIAFTLSGIEQFYREQVEAKPGAIALLKELHRRGIRLCLASATEMKYIRMALERLDIGKYFDAVLSCADLHVGKERPDIYLLSLKKLGLVAADACVFEDSFVALETARSIGCQTVGIFDRYNFDQPRLRAASNIYLGEGVPLDSVIGEIDTQQKQESVMVTQADIHAFLKGIGIQKNDTVLVHTSMRAIGEVEGGCDGLIDGFTSYLTEGLFLVPTHTWDNVGKDQPVFDVRKTVPCIGALPTVAAFRADGVRSLHPTHSVAAFGARAAEFVKGEENATTPCPAGGVWARLYDENAKILLIGVGLNRNTYIHAVDEMLELPERLVPPIPLTVIDYEGKDHTLLYQKHGKTGSENFDTFRVPLETCGALTYGKLGNAEVGVFDAKRGTTVLKTLWKHATYDLCKNPREIPLSYYLETDDDRDFAPDGAAHIESH